MLVYLLFPEHIGLAAVNWEEQGAFGTTAAGRQDSWYLTVKHGHEERL